MPPDLEVAGRETLFESGQHGYHSFRIPALACTPTGAILAFAEGRRHSVNDWGEIDLVVRRSVDGGKSFGALHVVVSKTATTCGNPAVVLDRGRVLLLFCENPADQPEQLVFEGKAQRSVWICGSDDDGITFAEPREITSQANPHAWTWYATGPGHGIQLPSGRLVVPCCHARPVDYTHDDPVRSHLLLSDDGGATWRPGGVVEVPRSSESGVVAIGPNGIYVDFRYDAKPHNRGSAVSFDAGETFIHSTIHPELVDPGCRGGICRTEDAVFISHPRSERRRNLVLECSDDGGESFREVLVIAEGPAAYSDLVLTAHDQILCAFETGETKPYERIDLAAVRPLTR
jgi:sialidase-1